MTEEVTMFKSIEALTEYVGEGLLGDGGLMDRIFEDKREYDDFDYHGIVTGYVDDYVSRVPLEEILTWIEDLPELQGVMGEHHDYYCFGDQGDDDFMSFAVIACLNIIATTTPRILSKIEEIWETNKEETNE